MNAVYRTTSFALCARICTRLCVRLSARSYLTKCLAIVLVSFALVACGNKGDLFLNSIELSAEQKAVLEGAEAQNPVPEETTTKKPKKKKTDTTPPPE